MTEERLSAALRLSAQRVAAVRAGRSLVDIEAGDAAAPPANARAQALRDMTYGTLRDYGRGAFFLGALVPRPLRAPFVQALILVALHRLESRPQEAHATVDQAVEAARAGGAGHHAGLVNAVLRRWLREREPLVARADADRVARLRHPEWWLDRLEREFAEGSEEIAAAGNRRPPMALRVNLRRASVPACSHALEEAGLSATAVGEAGLLLERPIPVARLPGFDSGEVSVQDLGAQRAAEILDARPGMRVLDACAAPGGKTAHILERADVELLALDAEPRRLESVRRNLGRLGLVARVQVADCRSVEAWWDGRAFERILADVPCTASGVARRHPDIKWLRRESDVGRFAEQQRGILESLWKVLAPDGTLLYATCSVFAEENERQVAAFARGRSDCERVPIDGAPALQLLPRPEHDGFFYALLRKRG